MWGALAGARFSGLGEDRDMSFRHIAVTMAAAAAAVATPALAQTAADDARFRAAQERFERELETFRSEYDRYQSVRRVPGSGYRTAPADLRYDDPQWRDEGDYDPSRYYSPGNQERALGPNDRVYTGSDGRYYCRRSDGTTGLIVGGALKLPWVASWWVRSSRCQRTLMTPSARRPRMRPSWQASISCALSMNPLPLQLPTG
jgi:hypothetical protein